MSVIAQVHARQILDSRGNPTVEAEVLLESGAIGRAAVPSGASTGEHEAVELRDGAEAYGGKGVLRAVAAVNQDIRSAIVGRHVTDQVTLDRLLIELDGTPTKRILGANAILSVSLAFARAQAAQLEIPLWSLLRPVHSPPLMPMPMFNVLNGGVHADNRVDFQEYMIVPVGADSFAQALQMGTETYHQLKSELHARGLGTAVGDEGGFAPAVESNEAPLELLIAAVERAGYQLGAEVAIALDPATSQFYDGRTYSLAGEGREFTGAELVDYWEQLVGRYPIVMLEDGMAENDWDSWGRLTERLGRRVQLVGDDIFVTSPSLLRRGIEAGIANSVLIKLNQVGTVTETLEAVALAQEAGYGAVISHRSGETEDVFIADFAVACGVGQIKSGAPARSERVAKYNQLLRIEEQLGDKATFAGRYAPTRSRLPNA